MSGSRVVEPKDKHATVIAQQAAAALGLNAVPWELRHGHDGPRLVLKLASPGENHFRLVNEFASNLSEDDPFFERVTLIKRPAGDLTLASPEVAYLSRTLSSTLTADRHASDLDFQARYVASQSGAEEQITATTSNIVFGRRGAGKSTLLVYALHHFTRQGNACIWIDMQTYDGRTDAHVLLDVLQEVARAFEDLTPGSMTRCLKDLEELSKHATLSLQQMRKLIPEFKRGVLLTVARTSGACIFLDDLHVLPSPRQPELLSLLYAFSRGSKVWLKVSALEHFTLYWDPAQRLGVESPGDAQIIQLDYNLTDPEAALIHTTRIMDAIAHQCALPAISAILNRGVLERLVWVAAGVPRDALDILRQSISSAAQRRGRGKDNGEPVVRKKITVEDVNTAASRCIETKLHFLSLDGSVESRPLSELLELIKEFAIKQEKRNAFLVSIEHEAQAYQLTLKLIDLRFLHVLNQGITKSRTGEKYLALLLDYGFYTGTRKAKTIDVLQSTPGRLTYNVLRKLPVFDVSYAEEG